ncbi:MAG: hypothetical protein WA117_02440 [Verrucomicrobiia bacterium]
MNLIQDIYLHLKTMPWLATTGQEPRPHFEFYATYAETRDGALSAFNSSLWADAKTEAQGDLTGYLAKHHYGAYGGHWSNLAKQSRALVEAAIKVELVNTLNLRGLPPEMIEPILVDVNRAALEIAYRKKFPKAPAFFERLLSVYEAGRLPCGWNGSMRDWPAGNVVVF